MYIALKTQEFSCRVFRLPGATMMDFAAPTPSEGAPPTHPFGVEELSQGEKTLQEFQTKLNEAMQKVWDDFGGPGQHLAARFKEEDQTNQFAKELLEVFPMQDDVWYQKSSPVPIIRPGDESTTLALVLHLSCFSIEEKSSLHGHPDRSRAEKLLDEILTNGFKTSGDPLKIKESRHLFHAYVHLCSYKLTRGCACYNKKELPRRYNPIRYYR